MRFGGARYAASFRVPLPVTMTPELSRFRCGRPSASGVRYTWAGSITLHAAHWGASVRRRRKSGGYVLRRVSCVSVCL